MPGTAKGMTLDLSSAIRPFRYSDTIRKVVQLRVFAETGDLKQVVDYMIAETESGLFDSAATAGDRP